jgi:galactose-1-phosphate uridylyltransferase
VESKTPRFSEGFAPNEGRIRFNETVIFPNAFPYDGYSAIAVICREHYLSLAQFGPALLAQAFGGCIRYLRRAGEVFADARQALLTWNYMPLAGAGLVHPHFHLAALPEMTSFYRTILDMQTNYSPRGERSIFDDVVEKEIEGKKRYLARMGTWDWLLAFAPRGIYEFWAISRKRATILEMEEGDIKDLAAGLSLVLGFLHTKGIQALNMSWYALYRFEDNGLRNWVSIVPRLSLTPIGTSDSNYFDRLLAESSTFSVPEDVTLEAKKFFEF